MSGSNVDAAAGGLALTKPENLGPWVSGQIRIWRTFDVIALEPLLPPVRGTCGGCGRIEELTLAGEFFRCGERAATFEVCLVCECITVLDPDYIVRELGVRVLPAEGSA